METKVKNVLKDTFFNSLMNNAKVDNCDSEQISFTAKYQNFEANFYANADDNFKVVVDDFGYMSGKQWMQCEPTAEQLSVMQGMINIKADFVEPVAEYDPYDNSDHPERNDYLYNQIKFN